MTTYSAIKRRIGRGTVMELVSAAVLPAGIRRTVTRRTSHGVYYVWSLEGLPTDLNPRGYAAFGTAGSVRVNEDGTWTRCPGTLSETTWRIVDV